MNNDWKKKGQELIPLIEFLFSKTKDRGVSSYEFFIKEVSEIEKLFKDVSDMWSDHVEKMVAECDLKPLKEKDSDLIKF